MIIDCFTFFNELELLEVRMHTLAPYVDAFVLCEANRTFQGAEKPYIFSESMPFFEAAKKRPGMIPVVHGPTGRPVYIVRADLSYLDHPEAWRIGDVKAPQAAEISWYREHAQRRRILEALQEISDEDRIILSDVDEIPFIGNSFLDALREVDYNHTAPSVISWKQDLYYYWVNMRCWDWIGPVSCTGQTLREKFNCDLQALRQHRSRADFTIVGGWHFSFLGGAEAIQAKIEAFSHVEYRDFAQPECIKLALEYNWKDNIDLFGRKLAGMKFEVMPDDSHLPVYLVANKERFKDWWYEGSR